ncbi:hypothetical protein FA13DRAFT_1735550 [Coprinellus micaceus]|uniref:Uncharacterized protein n=1 Tax=Coprinellus micaceus TaxID=71717 RepID=A0A4Y7T3L5_COPMI|nr:hypothetical protein FA13DRAFT_1735550 [Coprinellus micaceus]
MQSQMSSQAIDVTRASPRLKAQPRELLCETTKCSSREGEHTDQDLVNIALVNKSFSNLSLNSQWRTMHSLDPFISLLDYIETKVDSSEKPRLVNISLFRECTDQLRELVLDKYEHPNSFPILSAVRLAARLQSVGPIFTGVESVAIALPRAKDLHRAYEELGTRFSNIGSMEYLHPFTTLRSLSITSYDRGFPIFTLIEWIAGLNQLQTLQIDVLNNEDPPDSIHTLRSRASSLLLLQISGSFSFVKPTVLIFRDVSKSIKFNVSDSWTEGDEIETFIHSLNHPDLYVTFREPA